MKKEKIKSNQSPIKKEKPKLTLNLFVYLFLRFLVIICMVAQSIHGNWNNVFLCIFTLILFTLPNLISKRFNIELPTTLEIVVYLFIFSAEILGEIQNFYGVFTHWDTMLHTLNGFLCAAVGLSLIDILNNTETIQFNLTPAFVGLVAFCFSMTIGVLWEFCEFTMDQYFALDMQKDRLVQKISSVELNKDKKNTPVIVDNISKTELFNQNNDKLMTIEGGYLEVGLIDTMKDLFVNFVGAISFCILGSLYIKNRDDYKFASRFIPKKKRQLKEE